MREPYVDEELETIHVYILRERENDPPTIDAEPERERAQPPRQRNAWGLAYCSFIGAFFTLMPLVAFLVASLLPPYDAVLSKTVTLALSLHPTAEQVPLYELPAITNTRQMTVPATGSIQEPATKALGLLTFYNGLFTPQTVSAGTILTGKDGVRVVTREQAIIPGHLAAAKMRRM